MRYFLGVDGGGSGCRARLTDGDGVILGAGEAGPANIMSAREDAIDAIMAAALQALSGRDPAEVSACLGLAGAAASGAGAWLGAMLPFGRSRVMGDGAIAVAGALGPRDGIVAAMGTGSVFTRQLGGALVSIGGWGPILGDEGGGAWMGRRLLSHSLRARDGLAPDTPLARATIARLGGAHGVVAFARGATGADFAGLVPAILAVPDDPLARAILDAAADHVAAGVAALQRDPPLRVVFVGGLAPVFAARVTRWRQAAPEGDALDGALRLARAAAA